MSYFFKNTTIIFIGLILASCSPKIIQVPVTHTEYVTVRDTTILFKTDTLVQVPEVSISDYINIADTLRIETPYAVSEAWVDTTFNTLKGTLKQGGKLPVQIVEKERLVYRDSVVVQEKPVPVEVVKEVKYTPRFVRAMAWIGGIFLIGLLVYLLYRFGFFRFFSILRQ